MYGMTAAHKTLPLPRYARVTNLRNGRSVVVRINDRGPFVANRIIDLSYTAAAKLDMIRNGTTLVEVRALTPGVPDVLTRSAESPPPALYVQAGAFADAGNAQRLLAAAARRRTRAARSWSHRRPARTCTACASARSASVAEFDQLAARLDGARLPRCATRARLSAGTRSSFAAPHELKSRALHYCTRKPRQ